MQQQRQMLLVQEQILDLEMELRDRDSRLKSQNNVLDSIQQCLMETNDVNTANELRIVLLEVCLCDSWFFWGLFLGIVFWDFFIFFCFCAPIVYLEVCICNSQVFGGSFLGFFFSVSVLPSFGDAQGGASAGPAHGHDGTTSCGVVRYFSLQHGFCFVCPPTL